MNPASIYEVIGRNVLPTNLGRNVVRQAAYNADIPYITGAVIDVNDEMRL